jgi:hypothetical protein
MVIILEEKLKSHTRRAFDTIPPYILHADAIGPSEPDTLQRTKDIGVREDGEKYEAGFYCSK